MNNIDANFYNDWVAYIKKNIFDITPEALDKLNILFNEITVYNQNVNLVSVKEDKDFLYRHFADSLYAVKMLNKYFSGNIKIADIGTGAGFPGLPLKMALGESINITLVESITKKCKFIEHIIEKAKLTGINVQNARAEDLGQNPLFREKFDCVVSRAMSKFSPNLEVAVPLIKTGGYFFVYKTKQSLEGAEGLASINNAVKELRVELVETFDYTLPYQNMDYCLLAFKKLAPTPAKYPRKPGIPEKKPL
jgi:16S rRNA (guanine527-N7)-methyltransferase